MKALFKNLYLTVNRHMKLLAVVLVACLIPVAVVPALGWVVMAAMAALCVLIFVGDYIANWVNEI